MADYFISYTSSDAEWARWIHDELTKLDHAPHIHEREIKGGEDIWAWMQERIQAADHVLCVVTEDYLKAAYSTAERNAALWESIGKRPGFALLVVVKPAKLPILIANLKRIELHGFSEEVARTRFQKFIRKSAEEHPPTVFPGRALTASNIPIRVPHHFIGREESLAAIDRALARYEGRVAVTALQGMRGVGKTVLAAAYADKHSNAYRATWWIRAETAENMRADLVGLGIRLAWLPADAKEEEALPFVIDRLRHEGEDILLIYDNAVDANSLAPFLPQGGATRVLITTNNHAWGLLAEIVEIRLWPEEIGAEYLIARARRKGEDTDALTLSRALGGLPLAHEQAAAYCERLGVSFGNYRQLLEVAPVVHLDDPRHAPADYHDGLTVAKTFAVAIEEAAKIHIAAKPLILLAALFAPEPIPLFVFSEGRMQLGEPLESALAGSGLHEAVAALRAFALVDLETIVDERDPSITTNAMRLHRLVREVARSQGTDEEHGKGRYVLLRTLAAVYPADVLNNPMTWPRARCLDPMVLALVNVEAEPSEDAELIVAKLLNNLAIFRDDALAAYTEARPLYERALAIHEKAFGPDHPDAATILNNLALLLQSQGDFAVARAFNERALAINENALGPDHPNTALSLNNLAFLLQAQGDFAAARPLSERALAIREKTLGPDHPDTATSLNNLAVLLESQGDFAAARPVYERALAIHEKTLGPGHPDTARSLNNLAYLLHSRGDFAAARPLYDRALAICQKVLGPNHPSTETIASNLAGLPTVGSTGFIGLVRRAFGGRRHNK